MVLIAANTPVIAVPAPGEKDTNPPTSQSPADRDMEVTFAVTLLERETADPTETVALTYSPTIPAAALPPVVSPTMPPVTVAVPDTVALPVTATPPERVAAPVTPSVVLNVPLVKVAAPVTPKVVLNVPLVKVEAPVTPRAAESVVAPDTTKVELNVPLLNVDALATVRVVPIANEPASDAELPATRAVPVPFTSTNWPALPVSVGNRAKAVPIEVNSARIVADDPGAS